MTTLVSVVMSVYNEERVVAETIESILCQTGIEFEFIIVNDGSTDGSGAVLDAYASRDARLRVINQSNQGLTRALATGCAAATGVFIARQDAGDRSLPGRLKQQAKLLCENSGVVLATCGTRFIGPAGEELYTVAPSSAELMTGLSSLELRTIRGPSHHGSTMFRRDAYERVGGYRAAFRVAQDLDLWLRLVEIGPCIADRWPGYCAVLSPHGISSRRREEQIKTAHTIIRCARTRRQGGEDGGTIAEWQASGRDFDAGWRGSNALQLARFHYFLGSVLRRKQPGIARNYYREAIRANALFLPAWFGLMRTLVSK